jgi:hypothetical protein
MERFEERYEQRRLRDVGGTSGGLGSFLLGAAMLVLGGYWLLQQVTVVSHPWRFFGFDGFGISLVPLLFGVGWQFFDGKNPLAWLLTAAGALIIVAGIIASLDIWFRPANLFNTLTSCSCWLAAWDSSRARCARCSSPRPVIDT